MITQEFLRKLEEYPLVLGVPLFAFVWVKHGGMNCEWALEVIVFSNGGFNGLLSRSNP